MSKAFTKEDDNAAEAEIELESEIEEAEEENLPAGVKNLMTPRGYKTLQDELEFLLKKERPKIVEIVSWAAGNGDRSENGDYLYNKKKLREIDRRVRYLTKRLDTAEVVDPRRQQSLEQVFFGATVTYKKEDGSKHVVKLVGVDEADLDQGRINWQSAVARAMMKASIGETREVKLASGGELIKILDIEYIIEDQKA